MGIIYWNNAMRIMCFKQKFFRKAFCVPFFEQINLCNRRTLTGTLSNHKKENPLSSTSVIVQDGLNIVEMPCIVQVVNGEFNIENNGKTEGGDSYNGISLECTQASSTTKSIDNNEESEMALGFVRCSTLQEVFNLLSVCPESEITAGVALTVIKRIFDFENNLQFRNEDFKMHVKDSNFTFTRSALMNRLIETICVSTDPQIVVNALQVMARDPNKGDQWTYLEQLCSKNLILATDGKLTPNQVCEVIRNFHNLGDTCKDFVDKVWVGINEKQRDLTEDELCNIMDVLPFVKSTRMYLFRIVERKLPFVSHKLEPHHVIKIVFLLVQLKLSSNNLLAQISRWTNLNIHRLTEGNLRWITHAFLNLEYTDQNIQKALSRYMKAKKTHIKDHSLVAIILHYCKILRIRHPTILDFGSDYYIEHGSCISTSHMSTMVTAFGHLMYLPREPQKFFKEVEAKVDQYFFRYPPNELLDIFLSCVYLERYPINFVKKIFNPNFFDRLHSLKEKKLLENKEKLQLLDAVMTIEASGYSGPILPRNYSPGNLVRDARITRCVYKIMPSLVDIVGSEECVSHSYILPSLPSISMFVIDCLVDGTGVINLMSGLKRAKYALIILMPENVDLTEEHLLGPLELKKRILKKYGFKVVTLHYRTLNRLIVYPERLKLHLLEEMKNS